MTGRVQRVIIIIIVSQQYSKTFNLNYGVPQGSCLGPVLSLLWELFGTCPFSIVCCLRLLRIKDLPSVHGYADDTRLCALFHPNSFAAKDQAIKAIDICIAYVGAW